MLIFFFQRTTVGMGAWAKALMLVSSTDAIGTATQSIMRMAIGPPHMSSDAIRPQFDRTRGKI